MNAHKKAPETGAFCVQRWGLLPLGSFARRMARFIHKYFGHGNGLAFGGECPGDAVAVEVDQVPTVRSLCDQVPVYAFWF